MADHEEIINGEDEDKEKTLIKKGLRHDTAGVVELERVTDYAEEKEIISDISNVSF